MRPRLHCLVPTLTVLGLAFLASSPAWGADQAAIDRAVENGVKYLRSRQTAEGPWTHEQVTGMTALAGLTLLECGVPVDDPGIQKAAAVARMAAVSADQTYSLSLILLFLDRLGEPVDVALIESIAVRLLGGQTASGGWGYTCQRSDRADERRLQTMVKERNELVAGRDPPKRVVRGQRTEKDLPREIRAQLEQVQRARTLARSTADNSNTQFAVLALWVARRQGLPVDAALAEAEKRFHGSPNNDGGWGYLSGGGAHFGPVNDPGFMSTPAMTCSGLLGIGVAYGSWIEAALRTDRNEKPSRPGAAPPKPQDPSKDKVVVNAFHLLGDWIDLSARSAGRPRGSTTATGRSTISSGRWSAWPSPTSSTRSARPIGTTGAPTSCWPARRPMGRGTAASSAAVPTPVLPCSSSNAPTSPPT